MKLNKESIKDFLKALFVAIEMLILIGFAIYCFYDVIANDLIGSTGSALISKIVIGCIFFWIAFFVAYSQIEADSETEYDYPTHKFLPPQEKK